MAFAFGVSLVMAFEYSGRLAFCWGWRLNILGVCGVSLVMAFEYSGRLAFRWGWRLNILGVWRFVGDGV